MAKTVIRPATEADVPALLVLYRELDSALVALQPEFFCEAPREEAEVRRAILAKDADFLLAEQDGYIVANDAEKIGSASVLLGAGRQKKGDPLDFSAGITLHKKRGDYVHKGESLATFYGAADKFEAAAAEYRSGLMYGAEKPEEAPLVYALVTKDGVERY